MVLGIINKKLKGDLIGMGSDDAAKNDYLSTSGNLLFVISKIKLNYYLILSNDPS